MPTDSEHEERCEYSINSLKILSTLKDRITIWEVVISFYAAKDAIEKLIYQRDFTRIRTGAKISYEHSSTHKERSETLRKLRSWGIVSRSLVNDYRALNSAAFTARYEALSVFARDLLMNPCKKCGSKDIVPDPMLREVICRKCSTVSGVQYDKVERLRNKAIGIKNEISNIAKQISH